MKETSTLEKELRLAGAKPAETAELAVIARQLVLLKQQKPLAASTSAKGGRWRRGWRFGLTAVIGLALGAAIIVYVQSVLPDSRLFPIQKLSDNVAVSINPSYRGTIMMKRAQQVNQLVADQANPQTVLAALGDYQTVAATYKMSTTNYATFDFCKSNLREAANMANAAERQAILHSLASLGNA